jgi:hypothetical protein
MRIYVLKNKRVDFSGRTSSSTAVVNHRYPRGQGAPMRGLFYKDAIDSRVCRRDVLVPIANRSRRRWMGWAPPTLYFLYFGQDIQDFQDFFISR